MMAPNRDSAASCCASFAVAMAFSLPTFGRRNWSWDCNTGAPIVARSEELHRLRLAEHCLTVDVEQILLGPAFDPRGIPGQRHRVLVAGIAHHVEGQIDGLGIGELRTHRGGNAAVD